jgi:hypothetical protein
MSRNDFISQPPPLAIDDHSSETKSLLLVFFLAAGLILLVLSPAQIKYHKVQESISLFGAGFLAILSAAVLRFSAQFRASGARPLITRCTLAVVALPWCVWAALITYTHRVKGWDEGAYVLSGMALRGYHVPYASHRAPVTGFLCAAFIGWERFLNPLLLGVLLIAVYLWLRRLHGPLPATLSLLLLMCQNLLLESTVDITSELPAALLLLVGFFSLARKRFWWSALWFALVVFTRWNLAPVWAVVFLAVLIRFGIRHALKFLWVGLVIFSAWYTITVAMGEYINWPRTPNPLVMVYEGNFVPALAWTANPDETPDFLLRVDFYVKHFFFLTPFVLFALIASPAQNLRKHLRTELWVILVVLPLALLTYLFTMLNIGGLFPRFVTPLIPSSVVCLLCWLFKLSDDRSLPELDRIQAVTVAVFLTCAVGMWPLSAIGHVRKKENIPAVFSAELRKELNALDRKVSLYGIPREPLSRNNGNPAMAEARHLILFPSARRDIHDGIVEEPESIESVRRLVGACHSGDLLLIPKKFASEFQTAVVLPSDGQWALIRNP